MGNAGDTDCNTGVSISDSVDNGESGVFNSMSVEFRTEDLPGVYTDSSSGGLTNINGDRGFDIIVSHNGGDTNSDSDV